MSNRPPFPLLSSKPLARIIACCLLMGLSVAGAEPKAPGGDAIKKAQGIIRQLSQEKADLEADKNQLLAENADQQAKLKALENAVRKLQAVLGEVDRYKTGLESARGQLEEQLAQERQRGQVLLQKHNEVVVKAKAILADNQLLVKAVKEREQWMTQCSSLNQKLRGVNLEIVNRYKDKGLLQQFAELDPVTGIGQVETESIAEDYRYQLKQLQITPFQSAAPTSAAAETTGEPVVAETKSPDAGQASEPTGAR